MKRCRNTNLIFISIILLLSTFLFRNLIEPFDEISATQAAQILGDAAKAANTASDQAAAAAVSAKASYDAAMSRFQSNPSQANGIALSNAEAQNTAAQQAAADAAVAAASADSAAAAAVESIPVSSPSPPTVPSELESRFKFTWYCGRRRTRYRYRFDSSGCCRIRRSSCHGCIRCCLLCCSILRFRIT